MSSAKLGRRTVALVAAGAMVVAPACAWAADGGKAANEIADTLVERKKALNLPEENLLYFLEKNSLILAPWQREILRIVRVIAQYFYPQRQSHWGRR